MSVTEPSALRGLRYGAQYSENLQTWFNIPDIGTAPEHVFSVQFDDCPRLFLRWVITSDSP
jgi:hypothetical protein